MFKSKAQIKKWVELVKEGKISKEKFDDAMKATKNPHKLPERVGPIKAEERAHLGARFGLKVK